MTAEELRVMREALEQMSHGVVKDPSMGICRNLWGAIWECNDVSSFCPYSWVCEKAVGWPHYSGEREYPIPDDEGEYNSFPNSSDGLWSGEQGEYRKSLAAYLLSVLESENGCGSGSGS